ncbi:MAG: alpha-1,4 polygalactosaminidase, partial [Actinomycetota bacterium]
MEVQCRPGFAFGAARAPAATETAEGKDPTVDPVKHVYDMYLGMLSGGSSPEYAAQTIRQLVTDTSVVDAALERYQVVRENLIQVREPEALVDRRRLQPWYWGPREGDRYWNALRDHLEQTGFDPAALASVDAASTKVVAHLPPPWEPQFSGRGLVLGYVQSGKTSNFTAVIAKAADAGYRLVIVLAGMHTNLRQQTQRRLQEHLCDLEPSSWHLLTRTDADFGDPGVADAFLSRGDQRVLAVVKKNKTRLTNLINWLASASPHARENCPILVIDDEADQASVNTRDPDDRATINRLLMELLAQPRIAYVGYTATPFANIFVDPTIPEDLYPRDFIVDLPRPPTYFGPERLFGREPLSEEEMESNGTIDGLDAVRLIPDDEISHLRPPRRKADHASWVPEVTPSLRA